MVKHLFNKHHQGEPEILRITFRNYQVRTLDDGKDFKKCSSLSDKAYQHFGENMHDIT
jgi:hypothetical protein